MLISASIQGLGQLEALIERLTNFRHTGLMQRLGNMAKRQHERRVRSEKTSPDGAPWAPLRPFTVAKKGSSEIMVETGRLAGSFINNASDDIVRIWNSAIYHRFHQTGFINHWTGLPVPARPMIGLSESNLEEINRATQAFVRSRLGL